MRKFNTGDKVKLVRGTSIWGQYHHLDEVAGDVVKTLSEGQLHRISVAYGGETVFTLIAEGLFIPASEKQ